MNSHTRRAILASFPGIALAGCTGLSESGTSSEGESPSESRTTTENESLSESGTTTENELPEGCPTSLDLDVRWPRELDADTVGEFVTAYEEAYLLREYRGRTSQSRFHSADFSPYINEDPTQVDTGYEVTVILEGYSERPTMFLKAYEVDSEGIPKAEDHNIKESRLPKDSEYVSIEEVEDQRLRETLESAAESGTAKSDFIYDGAEIERYAEQIANLSSAVSLIGDNGGNELAYFDVNGTGVLLEIDIALVHGDIGGEYRYYVTEYVVWRAESTSAEDTTTPEDGELLECRLPE
ncbi:hypothetical protein [Halobellus ordinarius]|uniref:hypothetical protein n=1 Tax=Halobellus ordinarius TaxID=3075120 RepID=UPI0028806D77|nr:hypothetical protein [Halobellus sp. ZY16]